MSYKSMRKDYFRISEVKRKSRKWRGKALFWGLSALFFSLDTTAYGGDKKPLKTTIEQSVRQEIKRYAHRHNWDSYTANITSYIPSTVEHLPKCTRSLVISSVDYNEQPIGNLKRQIRCNTPSQPWQINIRVKVKITLPVVVAKLTINRDTKIAAGMLKKAPLTLLHTEDFVTDFKPLIGKRAKRRIRSGQIVSPSVLERNWLIEKGEEIVIIASKNGMTASTKGIALENGVKSQQIEVKNTHSNKVIHATVSGKREVKTNF